jgi:hypothetical protein
LNINNFLSELNYRDGAMPTNRFKVLIPIPEVLVQDGSQQDARSIEFWCQSVTFPGYQIMTHNVRRHTYGPNEARPYVGNFQQVQLVFISDGASEMLNFFHTWTQYIIPHDSTFGIRTNSRYDAGGDAPVYHVNYKDSYTTDIIIDLYNHANEVTKSISLREAFPVNINPITFDWSDNNHYTNFTVFIEFLDWFDNFDRGSYRKNREAV